jgi:hypothetical protein
LRSFVAGDKLGNVLARLLFEPACEQVALAELATGSKRVRGEAGDD